MKPHRLLLIICSFILVAVLAFWPGQWLRHAAVALSPLATPNSLQPQAPVPTLAPTDAVPAEVEPIVIATDAAPTTATAGSTNTVALLLIGAAFLFLGLAFIILRRVRS